ncbi:MAG TPA: CoA transferase [Candidatus Acidoferrum sp.]|nr:CoA transferase [Candidatus Acidoferrum sp.]
MSEKPSETYRGPLTGVRVVDLTRVLAGPYATSILGDMGAEVIKIEDTGGGDSSRVTHPLLHGISSHFLNLNRNKKSVAVDLKHPKGREKVLDLVRVSDVVVENFRPGVLRRLRLDYSDLIEVNPSVILCSISGFGQDSSLRDRPSYDVITQALSGAMSVTGEPGRPPVRLGVPLGDLSGGIFGALAILGALHERTTTGRGQRLDVSMLDGLVHLMLYYPIDYLNAGIVAKPVGGRHEHIAPYGVFEVADGYIVLAIFHGKFWRLYCEAIERPELLTDPRFLHASDRHHNRAELYPILEKVMIKRSRAEWQELLDRVGVPAAPILTSDQVATMPLLREREMFVEQEHVQAGHVWVSGRPIKYPDRELAPMTPAPILGEHTREILTSLAGTSAEQLTLLEEEGVVKSALIPDRLSDDS